MTGCLNNKLNLLKFYHQT